MIAPDPVLLIEDLAHTERDRFPQPASLSAGFSSSTVISGSSDRRDARTHPGVRPAADDHIVKLHRRHFLDAGAAYFL